MPNIKCPLHNIDMKTSEVEFSRTNDYSLMGNPNQFTHTASIVNEKRNITCQCPHGCKFTYDEKDQIAYNMKPIRKHSI